MGQWQPQEGWKWGGDNVTDDGRVMAVKRSGSSSGKN